MSTDDPVAPTVTERLAALLHEKGLNCLRTSRGTVYCHPVSEVHEMAAERLIAAGVGFPSDGERLRAAAQAVMNTKIKPTNWLPVDSGALAALRVALGEEAT